MWGSSGSKRFFSSAAGVARVCAGDIDTDTDTPLFALMQEPGSAAAASALKSGNAAVVQGGARLF